MVSLPALFAALLAEKVSLPAKLGTLPTIVTIHKQKMSLSLA